GFSLARGASYDPSQILIIDPMVLKYSQTWGQSITALTPMPDGSVIIGGRVYGSNAYATPGALSNIMTGSYVAKFSASGDLIWSTGMPGFNQDLFDILELKDGNLLIMGHNFTSGPPLPIPADAWITTRSNYGMGFLAITPDGSSAAYGTYFPLQSGIWYAQGPDSSLWIIQNGTSNKTLPITAGMMPAGPNGGVYIAKLDPQAKTAAWATYLSGNDWESLDSYQFTSTGDIVVKGWTGSTNLPVTSQAGQKVFGGYYDHFLAMFEGENGTLRWCTYLGGYNYDVQEGFNSFDITPDEEYVWTGMRTASDGYPLTPNAVDDENEYYGSRPLDYGLTLIDIDDGSFRFSTYLGGNSWEELEFLKCLPDGTMIAVGNSNSSTFPVTSDAAQAIFAGGTGPGGAGDITVSRFDIDGNLLYSTFWGSSTGDWMEGEMLDYEGLTKRYKILGPGNRVWLTGTVYDWNFPGSIAYPSSPGTYSSSDGHGGFLFAYDYDKDEIPVATLFPIERAGWTPENHSIYPLPDSTVLVMGMMVTGHYNIEPTSDAIQETGWGDKDYWIGRFAPDGKMLFSTLMGGSGAEDYDEEDYRFMVPTDSVLYGFVDVLYGLSTADFPLTPGTHLNIFGQNANGNTWYSGGGAFFKFKWDTWYEATDTVLPRIQQVCRMSNHIQPLGGSADLLLELLRNGQPTFVEVAPPEMKWQYSHDSLHWYDIAGATEPSFQPQATSVDTWFRRIILDNGKPVIYSVPAKLEIRALDAPTIDPGDGQYLCPGGSSTLGGSPTASGGLAPYLYTWFPLGDLNDSTLANPTVTPTEQIVGYTLLVEDSNECYQTEQVVVEVLHADIGEDKLICPGEQVLLSAPGYPGANNVSYTWNALDGSGYASIASPSGGNTFVNPSVNTTYAVTVSDGGFSGGVCPSDTVLVQIIVPPVADAGPDQFICEYYSAYLGTSDLPGHTYIWTPGTNINSTTSGNTRYDGSFPYDYPGFYREYVLTVIRDDAVCVAGHDTVNVFVGFAHAGPDGCGPRRIGSYDFTGGMASYEWTVIYGDTNSLSGGRDTLANPIINPAEETYYQLKVTLNGATCYDYVTVPPCGCPVPYKDIWVPVNCGDYAQSLPYPLIPENINPIDYTYEWTGGDLSLLDNPYSATPNLIKPLTSNQVYTLIARHKLDTNFYCTGTVGVSSFWGAAPHAITAGTSILCPGTSVPVHIGAAAAPGLDYLWTPIHGLSANDVSNPTAFPDSSTIYTLIVTDPATGCSDTALTEVIVREPIADGGGDKYFCSSTTFMVGTPEEDDMLYLWQPGELVSDSTLAQPLTTIYTDDIHLYLTVTDSITGCVDKDTVVFHETLPFTADAGPDRIVCSTGEPVVLGTTDSTAVGATYLWIPSTGLNDPTLANPSALPASTTTYKLIVSPLSSQGCESIDLVSVEVIQPGPLSVNAGPDTSSCGSFPVQIGPSPQPGLVYRWSPSTGLSDSSVAQPVADPLITTTYTLSVYDTANCLFGSDEVVIKKFELPTGLAGPDYTGCTFDSVTLGTAAVEGLIYSWSPSYYLVETNVAMPRALTNFTGSVDYYVTVTWGSCSVTDQARVYLG
ncbi:MAG TPA: hypothetical protein P5248_02735, partial [Bacteroidales bacterium]|nr:hypothetical protein [Bacteroidales bacterium]